MHFVTKWSKRSIVEMSERLKMFFRPISNSLFLEQMAIHPKLISLMMGWRVLILQDLVLSLGIKEFVAALHRGFSDVKWTMQKCIPEDDGGENIVAVRSEWTGNLTMNELY
jgi:hypothetical protein